MNLCSENHDEICYVGRNCPLCQMQDEKNTEIAKLEKENKDLQEENDDLSSAALRKGVSL